MIGRTTVSVTIVQLKFFELWKTFFEEKSTVPNVITHRNQREETEIYRHIQQVNWKIFERHHK